MSGLSAIAQAALEQARRKSKPAKKCRLWGANEERALIDLYPDTPMPRLIERFKRDERAIYSKASSMGLARSAEYMASEHACRLRKGDNVGAEFRFRPGQTPWNKGMAGLQFEGSKPTQFKKGNRPHTWAPIGTEQIRDGYLWRKITDNGGRHDWRQVHVMLWEEHHGPLPTGLILVFRDRNKTNIQIDNLELITRAENCRRNSIHRYPPELKEVIRLQKKVERAIRKRADEKSDDRSA
jgi:hypothetical protein